MMPVLHVVVMLVIIAALAIFGGIGWLPVAIALALFLLAIIAIYRRA